MTSGREELDPQIQKRSIFSEAVHYLGITVIFSAILATLFTAWTPASLNPEGLIQNWFSDDQTSEESVLGTVEPAATEKLQTIKIGIVAGHSGPYPSSGLVDPGATCDDGLTELEVNMKIAEYVVRGLQAVGYQVDLLEEWDSRLELYQADALVSIHADACYYINDEATGYKVSKSFESTVPQSAQRLVDCISDRYGRATQMQFHPGSITSDMTNYHTFFEIHGDTPATIIETGFLYLDRDFLTQHPEDAAKGIVDGILCYINNEPVVPFEGQP